MSIWTRTGSIQLKLICLSVTCSAVLSGPALADSWILERRQSSIDVRGSNAGDLTYGSISVGTADTSQAEVRFSCSEQFGLKVTISFLPRDQGELTGGERTSYKIRRSKLAIDGRESESVNWVHFPELRTVQNRQASTARKLFNAVITESDFTVKEPRKDTVRINLPPVDEAFKTFSRSCHVTNGS
ncbi:MAG: hypothetical protein AAF642_13655 [Pseudomonadota bacterium]